MVMEISTPVSISVMIPICLSQGVSLLEGGNLLEEVCHCGDGLGDLPPGWLSMPSLFLACFG